MLKALRIEVEIPQKGKSKFSCFSKATERKLLQKLRKLA